jgi:hypothetical protein
MVKAVLTEEDVFNHNLAMRSEFLFAPLLAEEDERWPVRAFMRRHAVLDLLHLRAPLGLRRVTVIVYVSLASVFLLSVLMRLMRMLTGRMIVLVAVRGSEMDPVLRRSEIVGHVRMFVPVNDSAVLVGVHRCASSLTSIHCSTICPSLILSRVQPLVGPRTFGASCSHSTRIVASSPRMVTLDGCRPRSGLAPK